MDMLTLIRGLSKVFFLVIFLIAVLFISSGLSQEKYPNKPITIFQPWMGGMSDTITRAASKIAEQELGQPVITEAKPGGTGSIAMNAVVKSKPDGYTLGIAATSTLIIVPHVSEVPFNVLTDITDVAVLYKATYALAVRADAPWKTFDELIQYARKHPGKFKYGTGGASTAQAICMERISKKEGIKLWTTVPFKSEGEAVLAVLGGHIDGVTQSAVVTLEHVKAGKLRILLILADKEWPAYPDVPHMFEKGYDFYALSYLSVYGPAGLPEPIRKRLEDSFRKGTRDPSVIALGKKFQIEVVDMGGKEYSAFWRSKYDEYGKVIKELGLQKNK
jgi:tripartite-type tricarboxylate transporter receptor subunit TctC